MFLLEILFKESFVHSYPRDFLVSQVKDFEIVKYLFHSFNRNFIFQWQKTDKCFTYLIYRWMLALFFVSSTTISIVINLQRGDFHCFFIYLTNINLCTTTVTTIFGALLVTSHHCGQFKMLKKMPAAFKVYWWLWNQTTCMAIMVSISYWTMNFDAKIVDLNNILVHITNSLVLIIDLCVVKHPKNFLNFHIMILFEAYYTVFTLIYQYFGGLDK